MKHEQEVKKKLDQIIYLMENTKSEKTIKTCTIKLKILVWVLGY